MANRWSKDEIAQEILRLYADGEDLEGAAVRTWNPEFARAARRRFGSWRKAIEYAGLDYGEILEEWTEWTASEDQPEPEAPSLERESTGQVVELGALLGQGGEGDVYAASDNQALVAKLYHEPAEEQARKLAIMLRNPPADLLPEGGHSAIAWPIDRLRLTEPARPVVGFLMPNVRERKIVDYYNPKTRRGQCPLFHYQYLTRTGRNLATAMASIHQHGYVIGDVNESNIEVSETALVTLIDADSFQVTDPDDGAVYRCPVGKPEFTPLELQGQSFAEVDRTAEHDRFGLAVLLFQLLMEGTHPFAGVYTGRGEPPPLEARIAAGHYPDSAGKRVPYQTVPTALPLEVLHPPLRALFRRCFEDGYRDPAQRPTAREWASALAEAEATLVTCGANDQHRYGDHLPACPWCARAALLGGRDPFPSRQAVGHGLHLLPASSSPARPSTGGGAAGQTRLPSPPTWVHPARQAQAPAAAQARPPGPAIARSAMTRWVARSILLAFAALVLVLAFAAAWWQADASGGDAGRTARRVSAAAPAADQRQASPADTQGTLASRGVRAAAESVQAAARPESRPSAGPIALKHDALAKQGLELLSQYADAIRWFAPVLSERRAWRLAQDITASSFAHGIDARLLMAVLAVETHFDQDEPLERRVIHSTACELKESLGDTPPTWKNIESALTKRYKAFTIRPDGCDEATKYVRKVGRLYYNMCGQEPPSE